MLFSFSVLAASLLGTLAAPAITPAIVSFSSDLELSHPQYLFLLQSLKQKANIIFSFAL